MPRDAARGALLAMLCLACGSSGDGDASVDAGPSGPVRPIFDPAVLEGGGGGAFFDFPYPSDLRTDGEGRPELSGFPRARGIVADAIEIVEAERAGFSPITGVYFRFTGALDPESLPARPEDATEPSSRVILVDVDPASPERGRRMPAYVRFQRERTTFWPERTLVVRAVPGVHLHPGRRYAAVVLAGLRAEDGSAVEPSPAFVAALGASDRVGAHYAALLDELDALGVPRDDVLVASAFTTSDPAREMDLAREHVHSVPLPAVQGWSVLAERPSVLHLEAQVDVYELIDGEPPYAEIGSGAIAFDAAGAPRTVSRRTVRVGLALPRGEPPPPGGFPVVLYGHGTGGDHRTHLADEGEALAAAGVATLGFEAALHGGRAPGVDVGTLVITNPIAARESVRQTVIDQMLFFRMLAAGAFDVPAGVAGDAPVELARSPVMYMGHSQGAQEAGVLLGVEPTLEVAFLSAGGGGGVITVAERRIGSNTIACTIAAFVGEDCEAMGEDHPVLLLLVQPLLDPADPLSFAHRFVRERPEGWAPLSIAMSQGTLDPYTPPRTAEALAAAIGLPLVEPVARTSDPLRLEGSARVAPPVRDNLALPGGARATGGLLQWEGGDHFAIYRIADARRRYVELFRTAVEGAPTIVGPAR